MKTDNTQSTEVSIYSKAWSFRSILRLAIVSCPRVMVHLLLFILYIGKRELEQTFCRRLRGVTARGTEFPGRS